MFSKSIKFAFVVVIPQVKPLKKNSSTFKVSHLGTNGAELATKKILKNYLQHDEFWKMHKSICFTIPISINHIYIYLPVRFYNVKTSTELSVDAKSTTVLCFVPYKLYTFGSRSKLRIKKLAVRFLGESVFIAGDARVVVCMDIKSGGGAVVYGDDGRKVI